MQAKIYEESGYRFTFSVSVYPYDAQQSLYTKIKGCGSKAVDFIIYRPESCYLMEVKNEKWFGVEKEKLDEKLCELFEKCLDTFAAIQLAKDGELDGAIKDSSSHRPIKFIVFISDAFKAEGFTVFGEAIETKLRKKFGPLSVNVLIENVDNYNKQMYQITTAE